MTSPPPSPPLRTRLCSFLYAHSSRIAESPLPAAASSAFALALYPSYRRNPTIYPRPLLPFAVAWGTSAYMTYDGFPAYGAGTMAAWSSMYLIANGWKRTMAPLLRLRAVGPAALGVMSVGCAAVGGWYWMGMAGLVRMY